jgi:hypothetical protein
MRNAVVSRTAMRPVGAVASFEILVHGIKKQHLPSKLCPVCQRPFTWRKKWERDWAQVKYCSERCKRSAKP